MKHSHLHRTVGQEWGDKESHIDRLREYVEPIILSVDITGKNSARILYRFTFLQSLSIYMSNGILIAFRYGSNSPLIMRENNWGINLDRHYNFLSPNSTKQFYNDDDFAELYEKALKKFIVKFASKLVTKRLEGE